MMKTKLMLFAALVLLVTNVEAKGKVETMPYPAEKVYNTALRVIAAEYRIEAVDKTSLTISFRTGTSFLSAKGQDVSVLVIPTSDAECQLIINTEKRAAGLAWGEGGKIQKKVLKLIAEALATEAK